MDGGRSESDEAVESAEELFRVALMAAGQGTELVLRARMEKERHLLAQARADEAYAQATRTAERDAARVVFLAPGQESWWEKASVDDVAVAWSTADAWSRYDPQAAAARDAIARTTARRWGVDIQAVARKARAGRGRAQRRADAVAGVDDAAAATDRAVEAARAQDDVEAQLQQAREARPASDAQLAYLRDRGLDPGTPLTRGEATAILTEFERGHRARSSPQGRKLAAEAPSSAAEGDGPPGGRRLEDLTGAERAQAEQLMREAGTADGADTRLSRSVPQQQAAEARRAAAPGFPLPTDAAVRMGPGKTKAKPAGPEATQSREQGRSR